MVHRSGVEGLKAFETSIGKLGILICYDNEFPMLGRRLAEMGVELVLAPSCTDTLAGSYRVRIGAQARALENQFRNPLLPHRRRSAMVASG